MASLAVKGLNKLSNNLSHLYSMVKNSLDTSDRSFILF